MKTNINAMLPWKALLNPLKLLFKNAKYLIYEKEKRIGEIIYIYRHIL